MPRVKIKVERGNGLQQVVVVDTDATRGATVGRDLLLNGAVATPAALRQWLGVSQSSSAGSGLNFGPGDSGDLLRLTGGVPAWQPPAALTKTDDTNVTLTLGGAAATALVNAASVTLGWTGQLAATRGGTGFGSYTAGDLLYANSTTSLLRLGIGSAGQVLTVSGGAPAWITPPAPANPTASVGLSAVNGSATTYMRSDAAPALSQSIAPTWTGTHIFSGTAGYASTVDGWSPGVDASYSTMWSYRTASSVNERRWAIYHGYPAGNVLAFQAWNDAANAVSNALAFFRSGVAIAAVEYGNNTDNPNHLFYGAMRFSSYGAGYLTTDGSGNVTASSAVGPTAGGTGFSSYTAGDILYANSTTTLAKLGIGGAGQVLTVSGGAPAWITPSAPSAANPTASVGLTAVNGAASTYMRSDAAPALDQSIAPAWTGAHDFQNAVRFSGEITPSQLTANVNDWNPTGLSAASHVRVSSDASRNITGLATGAQGRRIVMTNVGSNSVVLVHESGLSTAANRFVFIAAGSFTLVAGQSTELCYDGASARWRRVV